MASIITATTSSGLTQSADLSGVLQLASGTGNLVTVPSVTGTAMVSGNMPAFSAYATANQSVTSGVATKITLDAERFDTANCFASSRFTPNVAGYYQINATFRATGSSLTSSYLNLYKNGSVYQRLCEIDTQQITNLGSCIVYLNGSTDYIEAYGVVTASSGAAFDSVNSTGEYSCGLNGCLIRSA
jgi:hypothetical protein